MTNDNRVAGHLQHTVPWCHATMTTKCVVAMDTLRKPESITEGIFFSTGAFSISVRCTSLIAMQKYVF